MENRTAPQKMAVHGKNATSARHDGSRPRCSLMRREKTRNAKCGWRASQHDDGVSDARTTETRHSFLARCLGRVQSISRQIAACTRGVLTWLMELTSIDQNHSDLSQQSKDHGRGNEHRRQ